MNFQQFSNIPFSYLKRYKNPEGEIICKQRVIGGGVEYRTRTTMLSKKYNIERPFSKMIRYHARFSYHNYDPMIHRFSKLKQHKTIDPFSLRSLLEIVPFSFTTKKKRR